MRVAIIPARGGSKRIPRKNIKDFCGQPIIAYSINAALQSGCVDKVIVSTDDPQIAEIAKEYGAEVPFIRPTELADDYTGTIPVIKDAIEQLAILGLTCSEVLCLYATAPFIVFTSKHTLLHEHKIIRYFSPTALPLNSANHMMLSIKRGGLRAHF